jgi:glucose-fructose oxidoreductase
VQRGRLGEPRFLTSAFSLQVRHGNTRLDADLGGGPLPDIGIYCINAARYLFGCHPIEVVGYAGRSDDSRFDEVHETVTAILRFPGERLATFTCSFGASDVSQYQIVGTNGDLRVDPAYEYEGSLQHHLTVRGKTTRRRFPKRDQFAPQLIYFSDCILRSRDPEPGGEEGLADVRIIEAIQESIETRRAVSLKDLPADRGPTRDQEMRLKPPRKGPLVAVQSAHAD